MTGFGQAQLKTSEGTFRVEIKSVNHKFLEVSVRLPGQIAQLEETFRRAVAQKIRRGKISIFVSCPDPGVFSSRLHLNEGLAKEVFHKAGSIKKILGLKNVSDDALLAEVMKYPDVLVKDASFDRGGAFSGTLEKVLSQSLQKFDQSRAAEGVSLMKDLKQRASEIKKSLGVIEKRIPILGKEFKKSLMKRMKEFVKESNLDGERLTIEVAQYLKSSDISEEVTRMKSHLEALLRAVSEGGELGRKVDFIAQEMTRETNTIGAKSSDAAITDAVIAVKSAIEKIREQAQNVE